MAGRLFRRIGRRGTALAILGVMDLAYGSALIFSTKGSGYWPAFLGEIYGVPVHLLGAMWVVAGLFILTGVPAKNDALQFAVAVVLKTGWSIAACGFFLSVANGHGVWGPAAIYIGFASIILLMSSWPEDPKP